MGELKTKPTEAKPSIFDRLPIMCLNRPSPRPPTGSTFLTTGQHE